MTISKVKLITATVLVASAAAIIYLQYQTRQRFLADNESLRQQIAQLKSESAEAPAANLKSIPSEDFSELLRLRSEVSALHAQTNQIARLQKQNQQLKDSLAATTEARQQSESRSATHAEVERTYSIQQVNTSRQAVLAMIMYADVNNDQFPTNFDQATAYLGNSAVATNLNQFEITYHGSLSNVANPSSAILIRSTQPWMLNGKWTKVYGFFDGHSQVYSTPENNFDEWEQQHAPVLRTP